MAKKVELNKNSKHLWSIFFLTLTFLCNGYFIITSLGSNAQMLWPVLAGITSFAALILVIKDRVAGVIRQYKFLLSLILVVLNMGANVYNAGNLEYVFLSLVPIASSISALILLIYEHYNL